LTRREFRANRLLLGLTQIEVAKLLGMNRNTITKWEGGALSLPRIAGWAMRGLLAESRPAVRKARE
jgi:transcriptional regulator with XRE-family HTH domain